MTKRTTIAAAVAAAAVFSGAALSINSSRSIAEDSPTTQPAPWAAPAGQSDPSSQSGVDTITLAQNLAAWGRQNHNASALALAARIMATVPTKPLADARKDTDGKGALASAEHRVTYQMTPVALHAEAEAVAGTDEHAKAAIAAIDAANGGTTSRGAVSGAIRHEDQVNANNIDVYQIAFKGGELADIAVMGDGHTSLDLGVFDSAGNLVAQDCNGSDRDHVAFTPAQTQTYTIKIRNNGSQANAYTLFTN